MNKTILKKKLELATNIEERLDILDELKELKKTKRCLKKEKIDFYLNNTSLFARKEINTITLDDFIQKQVQENECCAKEMIDIDGMLTCTQCGKFKPYLIKSDSYDDVHTEMTKIIYTRISHFNEVIKMVQGKEAIIIPDHLIELIKDTIKKEKVTTLTQDFIKTVLKKHKLHKYFNHTVKILHHLGIPPPVYSKELEDKLCHMFKLIQTPYARIRPDNKSNFLNYYFVLSKLLNLLGNYSFTAPVMKNKIKRMEQNEIWEEICNIVEWKT